jgi:putative transposase
MNGAILAETLQAILPESKINQAADDHGVIERQRKLEIATMVRSLVLSAGSDDSGKLADAMRRYRSEAKEQVVRGAFYHWLDEEMAVLMESLLENAMSYAFSLPVYLPGILSTVDDWLIFDSETVTLMPKLKDDYTGPACGTAHGDERYRDYARSLRSPRRPCRRRGSRSELKESSECA